MKKRPKPKTQPQYELQIKNKGNFLSQIKYKINQIGRVLSQYTYWRSPLLWFSLYSNIGLSAVTLSWFFKNLNSLPLEVPIMLYQKDSDQRFMQSADIVYLILINLVFQIISLYIGSKIYYKSKRITTFVLTCSIISNTAILASIYKIIKVLLP